MERILQEQVAMQKGRQTGIHYFLAEIACR